MLGWINTWVRKQSPRMRARKLQWLADALADGATVLDVGVWSDFPEPHPGENWLEKQPAGKGQLFALGTCDMRAFKEKYPHVLCVQGDGAALPFRDGSIDITAANAVLEHVLEAKRGAFIASMVRVAGRKTWIAIPDRLCPLEVHTRLPFVHWLPGWRGVLRALGHEYWSKPENLNVISKGVLTRALHDNTSQTGRWSIWRQKVFGIPVSLIAEFDRE